VRSDFSVRDYASHDEGEVLALLRAARNDGHAFTRESPFWRWKHFDNPFGSSILLVAEQERVLGLRGFLRWELLLNDRRLKAVRAVDTVTHPEFRRRGVFFTLNRTALERARAEGVDVIFNTPNRYMLREDLNMGWTYVGRPQLLVRLLRPTRLLHLFSTRNAGDSEENVGAAKLPFADVADFLKNPGPVVRLLSDDDTLCGKTIRTRRSPAFLAWRYAGVPTLKYFAAWSGDDAIGAAVVFRSNVRRALREIVASEILVARPNALRRVIGEIACTSGADYIIAHARPRSPHWWALIRSGFFPLPGMGPHFAVHALTERGAAMDPTRLSAWQLSLGDLELF
jgi:hypothetical protein